jgi:acyl dehydratase
MAEELVTGGVYTAVVVESLNRTHLAQYAAASGDYHPVHHDDTYARSIGYPSVFAHGMLTMGLTGSFLERTVGRGTLTQYTARLVGQVWPGDRLTATLTVTGIVDEIAELDVQTVNQNGAVVLTGSASARMDDPATVQAQL